MEIILDLGLEGETGFDLSGNLAEVRVYVSGMWFIHRRLFFLPLRTFVMGFRIPYFCILLHSPQFFLSFLSPFYVALWASLTFRSSHQENSSSGQVESPLRTRSWKDLLYRYCLWNQITAHSREPKKTVHGPHLALTITLPSISRVAATCYINGWTICFLDDFSLLQPLFIGRSPSLSPYLLLHSCPSFTS